MGTSTGATNECIAEPLVSMRFRQLMSSTATMNSTTGGAPIASRPAAPWIAMTWPMFVHLK